MWKSERPHLIQGTLLDEHKVLHEIQLVIVIKHTAAKKTQNDKIISEIKFARQSPVPDGGPYILQYAFNGKQHKDEVHIKSGKLSQA